MGSNLHIPLIPDQFDELADTFGDTPETAISVHLLRRRLGADVEPSAISLYSRLPRTSFRGTRRSWSSGLGRQIAAETACPRHSPLRSYARGELLRFANAL